MTGGPVVTENGGGGANPFRAALSPAEKTDSPGSVRPFVKGDGGADSPRKALESRTIAEMRLIDRSALDRTPNVADLTVHDLNDLAAEFSGIPTGNTRVAELTIEDIQDIEAVFLDFKLRAGRDLSTNAALRPGTSVDISCCCCTPCCCCAAADMSHTA